MLDEEERIDKGEALVLQAAVDPKPVQNAAVSSEGRNKRWQKRNETRNKQANEAPVQTEENHDELQVTDEELVRARFESWDLEKNVTSAFMPGDLPTDDQGVPTVDATTVSSPSSHDDDAAVNSLDFLCTCFPDRSLAELATHLDQYSGDLDRALNAILSDFDSEEAASVSSSSSSSFFSSSSSASAALNSPQDDAESNSTTSWEETHGDEADRTFATERGDEYFDDDSTTNIATSKRARRAQRKLRKNQATQPKRNVLLETGLPIYGPRVGTASSLPDAAYPPLPPQPNKWHRLNIQVDAFMQAFPLLPRTTIASIVHQCGGDAVEAVEWLAVTSGAEPVWSPEESKEVDILLGNLINVFPEHDIVTLVRVVLVVMVEANVEEWEKERLVEKAVEVVLSRDREKEEVKAKREREESVKVNGVNAWGIGTQGLKGGGKTPFLPQGMAFDQATGEFVAVKGVVNGKAAAARSAWTDDGRTKAAARSPWTDNGRANTVARSGWMDNGRAKTTVVEEKYHDDDNDDPAYCRQMAMEFTEKRNEAFRKAAVAFQKAKGKKGGEGGISFYYSHEVSDGAHRKGNSQEELRQSSKYLKRQIK